ncbi:hypothetical protein P5673_001463 [Acropora cervicornis]|uniref:Uncharacterized protein n=1 Tax=Acropora cervicornis TaxID=6130 RepID=A0AAD9R6H2_ACRCE|nr:hypothetical protein P5673_001463 [Acropora cervicornis]
MEIGNGTVPNNGMYGNLGMERSRTMENMEIGNGTVPQNRKYRNLGMERSRTMENVENIVSFKGDDAHQGNTYSLFFDMTVAAVRVSSAEGKRMKLAWKSCGGVEEI